MAPESYTDATWDLKTDVWMFGVLMWGELRRLLRARIDDVNCRAFLMGGAAVVGGFRNADYPEDSEPREAFDTEFKMS